MWIAVFLKGKKKKCRGRGKYCSSVCEDIKCSGSALVWGMMQIALGLPWLDNRGPNPSAPLPFRVISPMGIMLGRWCGCFWRAFPVTHLLFGRHALLCAPVCPDMVPSARQMLWAPSRSSVILASSWKSWIVLKESTGPLERRGVSAQTGSCRIRLLHNRKQYWKGLVKLPSKQV